MTDTTGITAFVRSQLDTFVPEQAIDANLQNILQTYKGEQADKDFFSTGLKNIRTKISELTDDKSLAPYILDKHLLDNLRILREILLRVKNGLEGKLYNVLFEFALVCIANFWYYAWGKPFVSKDLQITPVVAQKYLQMRTFMSDDDIGDNYISIFYGVTIVKPEKDTIQDTEPFVNFYPIRIIKKIEEQIAFKTQTRSMTSTDTVSLFGLKNQSRSFDEFSKFIEQGTPQQFTNYAYNDTKINSSTPQHTVKIMPSLLTHTISKLDMLDIADVVGRTFVIYRKVDGKIIYCLNGMDLRTTGGYLSEIGPAFRAKTIDFLKNYNKALFNSDTKSFCRAEFVDLVNEIKFVNDLEWRYFATDIVNENEVTEKELELPIKPLRLHSMTSIKYEFDFTGKGYRQLQPKKNTNEPEISKKNVGVEENAKQPQEDDEDPPLKKKPKKPKDATQENEPKNIPEELEPTPATGPEPEPETEPGQEPVTKPKRKSSKTTKKGQTGKSEKDSTTTFNKKDFEIKFIPLEEERKLLQARKNESKIVAQLRNLVEQKKRQVNQALQESKIITQECKDTVTDLQNRIRNLENESSAKSKILGSLPPGFKVDDIIARLEVEIKNMDTVMKAIKNEYDRKIKESNDEFIKKETEFKTKIENLQNELQETKRISNSNGGSSNNVSEYAKEEIDTLNFEIESKIGTLDSLNDDIELQQQTVEELNKKISDYRKEIGQLEMQKGSTSTTNVGVTTDEPVITKITNLANQLISFENIAAAMAKRIYDCKDLGPDATILDLIKNDWAKNQMTPYKMTNLSDEYRQFQMLLISKEKPRDSDNFNSHIWLNWIQKMEDITVVGNSTSTQITVSLPLKLIGFKMLQKDKGLSSPETTARTQHMASLLSKYAYETEVQTQFTNLDINNEEDIKTGKVKTRLENTTTLVVISSPLFTVQGKPKLIAIESQEQFIQTTLGVEPSTISGSIIPALLKRPALSYAIKIPGQTETQFTGIKAQRFEDLQFDSNPKRQIIDGHSKIDTTTFKLMYIDNSSSDIKNGKANFKTVETLVELRVDGNNNGTTQKLLDNSFVSGVYEQTTKPVLREHGYTLLSEYEIRNILKKIGVFGIEQRYTIDKELIRLAMKSDEKPIEMTYTVVLNLKNA